MGYIIGIDPTKVRTSSEVPEFKPGSVGVTVDVNGVVRKYKYLQYESGAGAVACAAGKVAGYYAPGGTSAGATTVVTCDVSDTAGLGAGVAGGAPADGGYGWFQIAGPATVSVALTAGADGNALTLVGAGDGTLDVSALVTDAVVAYAVDASANLVLCAFPE